MGNVSLRDARRSTPATTAQKGAPIAALISISVFDVIWNGQPASASIIEPLASGFHRGQLLVEVIGLPLKDLLKGCHSPRIDQLLVVRPVERSGQQLKQTREE